MGVPDNTLLDLIEKVRSWIYWGRSDLNSMSSEVKMADGVPIMCCQCEARVSESCLGYRCRRCNRLFCESCVQGYGSFVVVESKSGTQAGLDIRSCKFCADFDVKLKFGGKFSHKIHPSDSPRQSPEPPSPNHICERLDGPSLQAVSVRRSSGRSDEDEAEDSSKNIFSPYSLDTSDVDSSSVNTRHEFYSFMSVGSSPSDSPSRIHFTSSRRRNSVQHEDQGTPRSLNDGSFDQEPVAVLKSHRHGTEEPENTTNDDLTIFRDQYEASDTPLDLENNGLIWFPLPPDVEETNFFQYADDDDDELGTSGAVFSSSDPLMSLLPENGKNVELKKPLETVVQGHFRALVSQLLQSEFTAADEWLDIITSLAWQAANYVKPDTSRGGSMDPGDYVRIKCLASGTPKESTFVKGVVCTKNIKHKRMTSQYKNPRLLILGGALEYQRSQNQLASIETLLQQEIDHLKVIVSRIDARRPNVLLVEKSVSPYAQEYLLAKEISLVSNIKRPLLERIARCTGAPITPSIDKISTTRLGQCELFRLEKFSEVHEAANQSTKKLSKTLMFFDGCPRRLGCTVLLKGPCLEELKKVKHVVQYAVFAAYHLSLETSFLADEGASLPKITVKPSIAVPERLNADNAISAISSPTVPSPSEVTDSPRLEGHDVAVDHQNSYLMKDRSLHTAVCDPLDGSVALECSRPAVEEIISTESTELEKVERLEVIDGSNEYYSATDNNQCILVSFSSRCVLNGTICERSRLLRIKFYGCFDKPLGRYLQDDLFDQTSSCRSCNEPAEAHVICYTHQQGNLTINVRRLPSLKLPGEKDGKIWMWHRCLRCAHVDGVPPATHRVVMSDAAWGLSFGKFLELSFSNHATANRIAGCGHSLQRDCLRFYGLGSMVVFFRYSPIDILSVCLPPSVLQFSGHVQQDWLKKDVSELLSKTRALYDEIFDVLHQTEQKSISDGDGQGVSDSGELSEHVEELKEMLIKERNVYIDLLQPSGEESVEDGRAEIDVFELNRLRHALMIGLHVWDRRISSLNSIYSSKPTHDTTGSVVEVKHRRCYSTFEGSVDRTHAVDDSEPNQIEPKEEPDGSPCDFGVVSKDSESISSDQFEEGHISAASFLSDKIDSAWTGPLRVSSHVSPIDGQEPSLPRQRNQPQNPHFRRLTSSPARVYSFDSAMTLQERINKELPPSQLPLSTFRSFHNDRHHIHMAKDPISNIHRSYSQVFSSEDQKLEFLRRPKPLFISPASFLPEGARLMLPYGSQNAVIAVYDNEPTSIISYALASKEYEEWFADKPYLNRNHSVASKLSPWQSFGSVDFDNMQYGNYGPEDSSTAIGSLFTDAKSPHHLTIPFEDESGPGGKVKFSVTCYFAKQFDALRKKCCPSEVDYMRSLSRCKRWSAQGGKSNAYFAKSLDDRFIIKQVTKTELESFEEFAPQYFKYLTDSLNSGSPTCLAKIVGIYQLWGLLGNSLSTPRVEVTVKHLRGGKEAKMHVMVMENLFFKRSISRVYDLKGSARSRYNSDMTGTNKTLLDMNLLEALRTKPIFLGSKAKRSLERAVWNDTSFLASIDVMDYSLLVGVDDESKELVLGIIDFMRQYTWDKQLETWVKASGILGGPKNESPTIISPKQYKRRFRKAMTSYFLTVPDQWSS